VVVSNATRHGLLKKLGLGVPFVHRLFQMPMRLMIVATPYCLNDINLQTPGWSYLFQTSRLLKTSVAADTVALTKSGHSGPE
jgi:hypothetical protein